MKILIRLFEKYGYLSNACKNAIIQNTQTFYKNKEEPLLEDGHLATSLYVIEKGCVRAFYTLETGQEIDLWYGFENSIIGSTLHMYKSRTSLQRIACMEPCLIHALPSAALLRLYREFPELNMIVRRFMEDYCCELEHRIFVLHTQNALGRYRQILRDLKENIQRIPTKNLASYLGVSQETLVRMQQE